MNLQMLALEKLVKSGVPVDKEDPVVKNTLYDVEKAYLYLDSKVELFRTRVLKLHDKVVGARMKLPDMDEYGNIRYDIESILFDEFDCVTHEHVEWKEYFMGLYNIVLVPKVDKYTTGILLNETLKYYDVLDQPKMLEPNDNYYVTVRALLEHFSHLKAETAALARSVDIRKEFRDHVAHETRVRSEYLDAKKKLEELLILRGRYWAILDAARAIGPTSSNVV